MPGALQMLHGEDVTARGSTKFRQAVNLRK